MDLRNKFVIQNYIMNKSNILKILEEQKQVLSSQFHILKIGLFGSYANDTNAVDSDLDLIFELEEGKYLGLKEFYDLEQFIQNLFDIKQVDLVNQRYLNPIIATEVEKSVIYV